MTVDMSQFHQVFFEESFEGLDHMEAALLGLSEGSDDPDLINTIFRAAHSIKGGSATFGFLNVAEFTHVMETLLDQMREGQREITREAVDLLLESGDALREMLTAVQNEEAVDEARVGALKARLDAMLAGEAVVADAGEVNEPDEAASAPAAPSTTTGWQIHFHPHPTMLQTGNDPVRMFRELGSLGELSAQADLSQLPELSALEPEESHLSWTLTLKGDVQRSQVEEIFEWVDDECDLDITPLAAETAPAADAVSSAEAAPEAAALPVLAAGAAEAPAEAPGAAPGAEGARKAERRPAGADSSIRVSIDKVDALINIVGELVITQSMLGQMGEDLEDFNANSLEKLRDGLGELERNTRELQESVMRIRMLPISFSFNRFPRLVHDLTKKLNKKIELKMSGEQTELDKTVMEKIGDPLVHLVRNSLDHGIESPADRVAAGKPETGVVHLNAFHQGGNIVIEIIDDGKGLDRQKILAKARERGLVGEQEHVPDDRINDLIFQPGFSTADQVSDLSGRGVGMDVVRRNIMALGGTVEIQSEQGKGSTFRIRLPLTLAILDGQLIRVGDQVFIIPLVSIIESLQIQEECRNLVAGKAEVYKLRDDYLPIVRMRSVFDIAASEHEMKDSLLVVVEGEGHMVGLMVDDLLGQQQVVIKSLESNFRKVDGLSGATILGDGTVALILDVSSLVRMSRSGPSGDLTGNGQGASQAA